MREPDHDDFRRLVTDGGRVRQRQLCAGGTGSHIDDLTGLVTRQRFIEDLDRIMVERPVDSGRIVVMLLELEQFGAVNRGFGPVIGDRLLGHVASRLSPMLPQSPPLARLNGACFAAVIEGDRHAADIAAQLLDIMGRPYAVGGHAITVNINIGFAVAGQDGANAMSLIHAADLALHQAEQGDGNRSVWFDQSMRNSALTQQELVSEFRASMTMQKFELSHALISEQFAVHYQPQISLDTGNVTGCEALLRWRHPQRGHVGPDRFIPIAEQTGLINLLGEWVVRTACRDAASWPVPGHGVPLRVAVNVSPLQLRDGNGFMKVIEQALDEAELPAGRLEIEITETAFSEDIGQMLAAIRRLGVDLALDDFGVGFSSLSRLHHQPFTRLKIDRSFVNGIDANADPDNQQASERMIRAIASFASNLGLGSVVEGIETQHQLEIARLADCTEMQGYLFSRPVVSDEIHKLIQHDSNFLRRRCISHAS